MIIKIVLGIIGVFIINMMLYFFVPSYNSFIKNLKYGNNSNISQDNIVKKDVEIPSTLLEKEVISNKSDNENLGENLIVKETLNKDVLNIEKKELSNNNLSKNKDYTQIINYFSKYKLNKIDYNPDYKMFYLTSEYFPEYIIYSGSGIDLYIYNNDSFLNVYNFFEEIKDDIGVSINKTNTFGISSFFINKNIKDQKVRLVINYGYILIGLNIDKKYYDDIKQILNNL